MDEIKRAGREAETETKKQVRDLDGPDVGDDIGNAGDEVKKDLGNLGDDIRRGGRNVDEHVENTSH
jgi:hypothetical protein